MEKHSSSPKCTPHLVTHLMVSVNISEGPPDERTMTTGKHIVRDISCVSCKEIVGWKYDRAYEPSEQYKEGKFILEHELLGIVK
jgi:Yippee zinc-binding/DNA-binding /Mis18, centromere assembly